STKFLGRGLGLSAASGIIRGHKGAIKVTSAPGQGTTFEVLFPASADAARTEEAQSNGQGAVLVVDGEEIVRNVALQTLARAGYQVLLAGNGEESLSVFSQNKSRISLVVLDLVMPAMAGEEALSHLFAINPDVRVIVSSGQDEGECMGKLRAYHVAGFLQKPYSPATLRARVQAALESAATAGQSEAL